MVGKVDKGGTGNERTRHAIQCYALGRIVVLLVTPYELLAREHTVPLQRDIVRAPRAAIERGMYDRAACADILLVHVNGQYMLAGNDIMHERDVDEALSYRGEGVNLGVARPKRGAEGKDEKKERKALAKEAKAARRVEKKGTKEAFREERNHQKDVQQKTKQLPGFSLSTWG